MQNILGVMQGRLLPKYKKRYQAHPVGYWEDEFYIAKDLELDCIEFILDANDLDKNPLIYDNGINEIETIMNKTDVRVLSICADYFMKYPFHKLNEIELDRNIKIIENLVIKSKKIGIRDIVMPCVDESRFINQTEKEKFINAILRCIELFEKNDINLSIESDLKPNELIKLVEDFNSSKVTINYDMGNSAGLGYNCIDEFKTYGHKISDVHIKDRVLYGDSVPLGDGNVNFKKIFKGLKSLNYSGPLIMQAYRDDEGLSVFKKQLYWIKELLNQI